jgi:hypothetical protein
VDGQRHDLAERGRLAHRRGARAGRGSQRRESLRARRIAHAKHDFVSGRGPGSPQVAADVSRANDSDLHPFPS